jgi:hypothetical protein
MIRASRSRRVAIEPWVIIPDSDRFDYAATAAYQSGLWLICHSETLPYRLPSPHSDPA